MQNQHLYIFCIIAIVLLFIFGFSIHKLIDKKLSDININIPRINVPEPNIIVKMKKKKTSHKARKPTPQQTVNPIVFQDVPPPPYSEPEEKKVSEKPVENFDNSVLIEPPITTNVIINTPPLINKQIFPKNINRNAGIPYVSETQIEEDPKEFQKKIPPYLGTILGCQKQGKWKLQADQIACNQPNYRTAEHYYDYYFKYPVIPQMDQDRWLPASTVTKRGYGSHDDYMAPDRNYRVVPQHYTTSVTRPPLPSNYEFSYSKR